MELFVDSLEEHREGSRRINQAGEDVRRQVRQITGLMDIQPQTHAPPVLLFAWGSLTFTCVLSRATQRFVLFRPDGAPVRRGDVLGTVADPFGARESEVAAPFDGLILGRAVMPVVNEGDAVFHLGRVGSVRRAETTLEDHSAQVADDPMFDEDEII
jgi:hypothetical protein